MRHGHMNGYHFFHCKLSVTLKKIFVLIDTQYNGYKKKLLRRTGERGG
jgi:hypothetical protein